MSHYFSMNGLFDELLTEVKRINGRMHIPCQIDSQAKYISFLWRINSTGKLLDFAADSVEEMAGDMDAYWTLLLTIARHLEAWHDNGVWFVRRIKEFKSDYDTNLGVN